MNDNDCYLSFGHWIAHYSPYVINLRNDQNKIWNLREKEGLGKGLDLYLDYVDPGTYGTPCDLTI